MTPKTSMTPRTYGSGSTAPLPVASARDTARTTLRLLARHRLRLAGTVLVLLTATAAALAVPALLGTMVDAVAEGRPWSGLLPPAGAIVAATGTGVALGRWGQLLLARTAQDTLAGLREDVFATAVAQPSSVLEQAGSGDLVSRVAGDAEAVNTVIGKVLPATVSALFTIALTLIGIGVIDLRLALAVLAATPVQYLALRRFLARSGPVYRAARQAEAARGQRIVESLTGADTVAALRAQDHHTAAVAASSEHAIGFELRAVRLRTTFYGLLNLAEFIGLAAVLAVGYHLVGGGAVTLGAATAAALYFHRLFDPIGVLLSTVDELQNAGAGLARLVGILSLPAPRRRGSLPPSRTPTAPGRIALDHVSYGYAAGRRALDAVSLTVEPGETVAVVGASGAGKTTLAKILAGVLTPDSGRVLLDGVPLAELPADVPRRRIVLVSQEVHVFDGTVAEDLRLFAPDATDAEIRAAADRLGATGWLDALPEGLGTRVGAGGQDLTAARAQHLALLRLALVDPDVALLDEATAEAGTSDADLLENAAAAALADRTGVVIAHRLSQAARADRIVVMDAGRIVESGTHPELAAAEGPYARLWEAWNRAR
ncbi:ABC transporter ATP-binding protein/permease [Streptomyces anulatus]|uniref:ABC transporter ATP-binding protein n=1 Tax=Streptomyces anulatus TaxID=1892 RepID=UPI0022584ABD|nr:ABC transporter ATP-binding protein [Streptomyces anulatus]MCX4485007.1 ABC transporter ATP-binding protein/permease [Streptomyces anulatus]MCX4518654.1 ABC transporter ATP-binding protein/permease [Streptomyces anulatus]MCX4601534.1 ABC transporter ATP-binding protein/permease [Streptomyces anulatus]WSI77879.1 ABC transporter ATP-binding protein/permease [Streptomyces anulatus]WSU73926.1 ABC transporter ATP-binding protein/permease [Streptomyces anulatus]